VKLEVKVESSECRTESCRSSCVRCGSEKMDCRPAARRVASDTPQKRCNSGGDGSVQLVHVVCVVTTEGEHQRLEAKQLRSGGIGAQQRQQLKTARAFPQIQEGE
jgi:hypothetical protein